MSERTGINEELLAALKAAIEKAERSTVILEGYLRKIQDQYDCYLGGADPKDCLAEIYVLAASALTGSAERSGGDAGAK